MTAASRIDFPDHLLVPESGWLSGFVKRGQGFRPNVRGEYTVIVPLCPFDLPSGHLRAGERITTSLQFEGVRLPTDGVRDLERASFDFPKGSPDWPALGEMYIAYSYVPIVLHRIEFGGREDGMIEATLGMRVEFDNENGGEESGFRTRDVVIRTSLELDTQPALLPAYSLLGGAYRPTTGSILFFDVPPARLVEWLVEWMGRAAEDFEPGRAVRNAIDRLRRHRERGGVSVEHVTGGLREAFQSLEPLSAGNRKYLIAPTRSSWTAYFDNSILGTDPSALINLPRDLSCRAVRMSCGPEATIFELYDSEEREGPDGIPTNFVRSVYAANDGGYWTFGADGEKQPFEIPQRYAERRIRDRFTPEMLRSYLAALGIRAFDEDFYEPGQAVLVEQELPVRRPAEEWTFEEVQAGLPWAKER